jgi:plasmid stabilization system protein ParE
VRYRVEVTRRARHDIGNIYAWLHERAPAAADRWLAGLHEAIATLAEMPHRCAPAPEAELVGGEPRQLLFQSWRILFDVAERRVVVLHVRHSALPLDARPEE